MKNRTLGRIGVLAGGPSNEREISLRSGKAVYNSLMKESVDAVLLDVGDDICDILKNNKIDVAFIALHGRFGEDGTVQKVLEDLKIAYTGSGPEASKFALDKVLTKKIFKSHGISTPDYVVLKRSDYKIADCQRLGLPVVVKPHLEGSSIGLSVVRSGGELPAAIEKAFEFGDMVLVEEYISGRELTVGILNDEPLPVIEIMTKDNIYDFKAKYVDTETKYLVPAPIDASTAKRVQKLGKDAHHALGCRCFSRVDIMMDGVGKLFALEVNTIPGMTERSLLPKAASAMGLSFGELCIRLIEDAIKR